MTGLDDLIGVIFLVLKLTHVIEWSWWFVTMPFYICPLLSIAVVVFAVVFCLICAGVAALCS